MNSPRFRLWLSLAFACAAVTMVEAAPATVRGVAERFCVECHDAEVKKGNLDLASVLADDPAKHPEIWEKAVRRLSARQMPPASRKSRPTEAEYLSMQVALEQSLDAAGAAKPNPGRTETIRRLNRTEYQNAIRDLLAVEIDAANLLPRDDASHGFDNVTVGVLSPTLLDRYITAAQKISRLAVGAPLKVHVGDTIRIRPDLTQEERIEGLPFGTRGGALIRHTFPRDGSYDLALRLSRDRNEEVEGLKEPHTILVLLDSREVARFTVTPPKGRGHQHADDHLQLRFAATAGVHELGVTFLKQSSSVLETKRQPYEARFNFHRHPRTGPALFQVSLSGPFDSTSAGDSASRRRIFVAEPKSETDESVCAEKIIRTLLRRAWRRPVTDADLARVLPFYEEARKAGTFDSGIEAALTAILVSPEFLLRVEREPSNLPPGTPYRLNDIELASRLSFFLWSSLPDDELLELAERGQLSRREVLVQQARRMLADPRSLSLVENFAGQWLHLRNLESISPDARLFPDFDDNLRQAMRRETELLFEEIVRDDRSVLNLLQADHAYLNERLAKHYGIPHIYGSHFRRVSLGPDSPRGGLLRQGSVLTVTSYATRTSPVIRGKWILENLMGTPPPPPAPDVPALDDNSVSAKLPIRERLAAHRNNAACVSCH
jgi:hypothetical protein